MPNYTPLYTKLYNKTNIFVVFSQINWNFESIISTNQWRPPNLANSYFNICNLYLFCNWIYHMFVCTIYYLSAMRLGIVWITFIAFCWCWSFVFVSVGFFEFLIIFSLWFNLAVLRLIDALDFTCNISGFA